MDGAINNIRQTENIEGVIKVLMKELAELAPHPNRPNYHGPLFVAIDSSFNPPAEYEGLMGAVTGMAGIFANAAANSNLDWKTATDCADDYIQDRSGKPVYQGGQRNVISMSFNHAGNREALMKAYYADLPKRLGLEANLALYLRKLCSARKNKLRYVRPQAA